MERREPVNKQTIAYLSAQDSPASVYYTSFRCTTQQMDIRVRKQTRRSLFLFFIFFKTFQDLFQGME